MKKVGRIFNYSINGISINLKSVESFFLNFSNFEDTLSILCVTFLEAFVITLHHFLENSCYFKHLQ